MTLLEQLRCFSQDFRNDLYYDLIHPSYRKTINKFMMKKISIRKHNKHNYNYVGREGGNYKIRKVDQKSNIKPVFAALADEKWRTQEEHAEIVNNTKIRPVKEAIPDFEEWCQTTHIEDIEAFKLVNNLMAQSRNDISLTEVKINLDFSSGNRRYRRNGEIIQRYRTA